MISRFDLVGIVTVKNVVWVSGPAGRPANPHGRWSVVGNIGDKLLLSKDETIIQIPVGDVYKLADYSIEKVIEGIKKVRNLKDLERYSIGSIGDDSRGREETKEGPKTEFDGPGPPEGNRPDPQG